jgi:hypothetical protein
VKTNNGKRTFLPYLNRLQELKQVLTINIIEIKIQIENLKAQMTGRELNIHQKADALIEFNKLLDYVDELEQLTIPAVVCSTGK